MPSRLLLSVRISSVAKPSALRFDLFFICVLIVVYATNNCLSAFASKDGDTSCFR
jgi:hypothetical protein